MTRKIRKTHVPDAGGWLPQSGVARPWRSWLEESGSLTARVVAGCPVAAPFAVRVLSQRHDRPHGDERALIGAAPRELVCSRDVLLLSGTTPVVYAHTVTARGSLRSAWHLMDRVGSRALGSVLFADPRVVRGALSFRRLDARHPLFRRAIRWCQPRSAHPSVLWARRAVFELRGKPLLVTEVFLPAILGLQP